MNTCDTCKHWSGDTDEPGTKECHETGSKGSEHTVSNGEPYNSGIVATGPKFGCIHHEPNP